MADCSFGVHTLSSLDGEEEEEFCAYTFDEDVLYDPDAATRVVIKKINKTILPLRDNLKLFFGCNFL